MKTKKIKLFQLGLFLMLIGFGLFVSLVFSENSIFEPGVIFETLMKVGFFTGLLGLTIIVLWLLMNFFPGVFAFFNNHKQLSKGYLWLLFIATGGLLAIVYYAVKMLLNTFVDSTDDNESLEGVWSGDPNSTWSEDEANAAGIGSHQWWDRHG